MTEEQQLQLALKKAIALSKKLDKAIDELPPEDRDVSIIRMRNASRSMVTNLAMAVKTLKG